MRRQVARFSAGVISVQRCTSRKVLPQPLQTASPWLVEQIAMQGASGVVAYQASQASRAAGGMALAVHILVMHHGAAIAEGAPEQVVRDRAVIDSYLGVEAVA